MAVSELSPTGQEAAELAADVRYHQYRYYALDDPEISDQAFDALFEELRALEAAHPALKTADSLSEKVGAAPASKFGKVTHAVPMLSLSNAFADEEVIDFVGRVRLGGAEGAAVVDRPPDGQESLRRPAAGVLTDQRVELRFDVEPKGLHVGERGLSSGLQLRRHPVQPGEVPAQGVYGRLAHLTGTLLAEGIPVVAVEVKAVH